MSPIERLRVTAALFRYDMWLDIYSVPIRARRELRRELRANLTDAAAQIGVSRALLGVGSIRKLAHETSRDGRLRSSWSAGSCAAISTFAVTMFAFLMAALYYAEGVLDAEPGRTIRSDVFPFLGASIQVNDTRPNGFGIGVSPGAAPFLLALFAFVIIAKPWRALRRTEHRASDTANF